MPPIKTTEVWQNLISQVFLEDIGFDPQYVERFFVNNLVTRTLAHLVGQGRNKGIQVRATEGGALIVAPTATAIEDNEVFTHTFVNDDPKIETFDHVVARVDMTIWTNPVLFRHSPDGTRWGAWIEVNADCAYSFDCNVKKIEIKNKTAGSNARYQIVGWY